MKKLNLLSVNKLAKSELAKREMNILKGGAEVCPCICIGADCGCKYEGPQCPSGDDYYGGSSQQDNYNANGDVLANTVANNVHG